VVPIANALRRTGEKVAIEGVVTAPAGLLDGDSRRVTVQDTSAAILVRLPADGGPVELGRHILVVGEIGTYYGAPQIAAADGPVPLPGGGLPAPIVIHTSKLTANNEWRLVSVRGTVTSIQRDGDAWKAELDVGGGSLPVSGLARSAIPSTALVVGRSATIIGIVKRPYPTASDQRFTVVPRMPSDIKLGEASTKPDPSASPGTGGGRRFPVTGAGSSTEPIGGGDGNGNNVPLPVPNGRPLAMTLADIAAHEGELVSIGGRIEALDGDRLLVADGTSLAAVRLAPEAAAIGPARPGMLINARGTITRTEQGGLEIVVDKAANLRLLDPRLAVENDGQTSPAVGGDHSGLSAATPPSSPAGNALPFALAGLLALAGMVGSAGLVIAYKPQLLRALKLALANVRTRD